MILWGGRFLKNINKKFLLFNNSLKYDFRLAEFDIIGSIMWSKILVDVNVLNIKEQKKIELILRKLLDKIKNKNNFCFKSNSEDIHSWLENYLISKIGNLGKKLNTGRSRNDQIATDIKLWCKKKIFDILKVLNNLLKKLINLSELYHDTIFPGYTHLQCAQPITFSHWCLCYFEMFLRDKKRLLDIQKRLDISPLGSGALSGTSYKIDRDKLAKLLGFSDSTYNSIDAVSSRDYLLELASNASISMINLSRFSEDFILFSSPEFNLIELSDAITSGSSLMPQKKNPDLLELIRGKSGRVFGSFSSLLVILKSLPMSYNKDMQEDKKEIFDALDTWQDCLYMAKIVLKNFKVNIKCSFKAAKKGYSNATDLADYLVDKGMLFRDAHNIVGKIVLLAIKKKCLIEELSLKRLKKFSFLIDEDVYKILTPYYSISKKDVKGGVSLKQILLSIKKSKSRLMCN